MLLRLEGEGVHIDVSATVHSQRHALVMLVGLHKLEIRRLARRETVVAVELNLRLGVGVGVLTHHTGALLHNPDELLHGVVEVQLGGGGERLVTSELKLFNEVLVRHLSEATALVGVKVHVVDVQGRIKLNIVKSRLIILDALAQGGELDVDLHLVVLKGNEGKRKAGVTAKPELKGYVQGACRLSIDLSMVFVGGTFHHRLVAVVVTRGLGKLVPDVEPVAIVLVDALTTDLDLDGLHYLVANPFRVAFVGKLGKLNLQIHAVNQITVTRDGAGHFATEVRGAVEHLGDRLHGKVGMPAVHHLEEGDLRVAGKVDVLSTIRHELH